MRWFRLILALAAAAWLAHAAFRFLGSPFPGYGMWIGVPMNGAVHFENGNLRTISGSIHAIDFSPWWLPSMTASIALLLALAPTGGHPSLEALLSLWLGVAKIALVPAALLLLVVATLRGEQVATIALGAICVIGETLYTVGNPDQPLGWFAWIERPPA